MGSGYLQSVGLVPVCRSTTVSVLNRDSRGLSRPSVRGEFILYPLNRRWGGICLYKVLIIEQEVGKREGGFFLTYGHTRSLTLSTTPLSAGPYQRRDSPTDVPSFCIIGDPLTSNHTSVSCELLEIHVSREDRLGPLKSLVEDLLSYGHDSELLTLPKVVPCPKLFRFL